MSAAGRSPGAPAAPGAPEAAAAAGAPEGHGRPPPGRWAPWLPGRSIKRRLVLVFLLLAVALAAVFIVGAQRAFTLGWRDAARPLLADYVDRLAAEVLGPGDGPPSVERAQALAQRLPLTLRIEGPAVNWASHPAAHPPGAAWREGRAGASGAAAGAADLVPGGGSADWSSLLQRSTADGHTLRIGFNEAALERRQRQFGFVLVAVLLITLAAYLLVRRLLRPLDDIRAGAQRFGAGVFDVPIPVRHTARADELDQLAATVNTMAGELHQMLEAQRGLLLAISHELRSPLTRARLHAELLPETGEAAPQRQALLRDLHEMAQLVNDLLESERLAGGHAALRREPVPAAKLVQAVVEELCARHPRAAQTRVLAAPNLPLVWADPTRLRLLLRNLLDNAWRHGGDAPQPPEVHLTPAAEGLEIRVRDHGPGVPQAQLSQLAQAFYRPDSARTRAAGGVGLGLYLCRLVAQAHGGRLTVSLAHPGLQVQVLLPFGPAS